MRETIAVGVIDKKTKEVREKMNMKKLICFTLGESLALEEMARDIGINSSALIRMMIRERYNRMKEKGE